MDFSLDKLLSSLNDTFEQKVEDIKKSMRDTTEAYRETVEKSPVPEQLLQQPQKPYTLRDQLYDADKAIGAPRGLHYGALVAENGGFKGGKLPTSEKAAEGLAQQTPIFLKEMKRLGVGDYDPQNPVLAISRMTFDLKRNYEHFKDWDKALAAYNAGRGSVIKAGDLANLPKETKDYIEIVNYVIKTGKGHPSRGGTSEAFERYLDTPVTHFFKEK